MEPWEPITSGLGVGQNHQVMYLQQGQLLQNKFMLKIKEILFGLGLAVSVFIVLRIIGQMLLAPYLLGNYADPLYLLVAVLVTIGLAVKKYNVSAITFAICAFFLFTPILIGIVGAIGCSMGQCPIF